jgi:hypothetical protein
VVVDGSEKHSSLLHHVKTAEVKYFVVLEGYLQNLWSSYAHSFGVPWMQEVLYNYSEKSVWFISSPDELG